MKKTAQDIEIEKLRKLVEKLKTEKKELRRKEKSALGKLATARAKADKYHNELKKKDTTNDVLSVDVFKLVTAILDGISIKR